MINKEICTQSSQIKQCKLLKKVTLITEIGKPTTVMVCHPDCQR